LNEETDNVETNGTYPKLTEILRSVFDDDTLVASPTLAVKDVPNWDSLRTIRLVLTIEKTYGVRFSASEIVELHNVGDLARLIENKL